MRSSLRILAAVIAAISIAALSAAPAHAQDPPCGNVPECVNETLTTVERTIDYLQYGEIDPGRIVDRAMCEAYWLVTGRPCPEQG